MASTDDLVDGGRRHDDPYIELTLSVRGSTWRSMMRAMPQSPERRELHAALEAEMGRVAAKRDALDAEAAPLRSRAAELERELAALENQIDVERGEADRG